MAQTNYTPIILYNSGTTTNAPSASNLASGELAINYTDGKLFYKDNSSAIQVIGWKTTPTTAGGTGLTSYTAGDLPYYASGSTLSKLGIGTSGYVLQSNGSAPTWVAQSTLSVGTATNATNTAITDNTSSSATWYPTIVSATTGNLPQTTSSTKLSFVPSTGTLTATSYGGAWAGSTIGTTYGGTGLTSFTANGVVYASSTSALATGSALQFDGTNLGIGVTPSAWASDWKVMQIGSRSAFAQYNSNSSAFVLNNVYFAGTGGSSPTYINTAAASYYQQSNGAHYWGIAPSGTAGTTVTLTQAMTLDASNNLFVGYTSGGQGSFSGLIKANAYNTKAGAGATLGGNVFNINWTGNPYLWIDTTNIGQIATVSDYRLKENVTPQKTALDKVMQLQPVEFNRKAVGIFGGSSDIEEGFLAHQLQAIIPSAVYGEKDAVTEDGSIQPQSLNWSPVVSVLVKAIQEQQAMITTLQTQVTALKG